MISNTTNRGNEVRSIVNWDIYQVRRYSENHFHSILDVGANLGIFSVFMRMRHPDATIVAVEPCIEACRYLRQNTNMLDICLEEKALGNGQPFYFIKRGKGHILDGMFFPEQEQPDTYRVETITLKELNDKYKVRRPYALKFNCEGGEKFLIGDRSAEGVLKKAEYIGMQIHYQTDRNQDHSKHWLKKEDYEKYFQSLLGHTHSIQYHKSNDKLGTAFCLIHRK